MRTLSVARGLPDLAALQRWVQEFNRRIGAHPATIPPASEVDEAARPAVAYANHGEWVADCPDGCGGAEVLQPGWPFMCCKCANLLIRNRWRPVAWPKNREAIDLELDARPFDRFRNWFPGESIKVLQADTAILWKALRADDADPVRRALIGTRGER